MPLILGTNSIKDTGYNVANSLRFNDGSSDTLSKTPSSAGNRRTWTYSAWMKRTAVGTWGGILDAGDGSSWTDIYIFSDDTLTVRHYTSGTVPLYLVTNRKLRDVSAWMHIVVAVDTTQSTASNRCKVYINGTQETSFSSESYPTQNYDTYLNSTNEHRIGISKGTGGGSNYFDGYLAEVCLIDGTALDQTSFGEFDSDSPNIWKPKDVSGLTFGTNGFHLDFENASSLGADVSGNSNNFTVNNLTSVDQSTDTCTNNFATMNPLNIPTSNPPIFSEGNLQVSSSTTGSGDFGGSSTIGVSSGKWFVETKVIDGNQSAGQGNAIGISGEASKVLPPSHGTATNSSYAYKANGDKVVNGSASSYGATFTQNDIIGIALDLDSSPNTVTFYKNGASQGAINIVSSSSTTDGFYFFIQGDTSTSNNTPSILSYNFGSPAFSISSGNSDANGHGNFEYAVPSGYFALCTKNLAEYG